MKYSDGWHTFSGCTVYVEDGCVVRAVKRDRNGSEVYAAPYRWSNKFHCWLNELGLSVDAFRAGVRRGSIEIK